VTIQSRRSLIAAAFGAGVSWLAKVPSLAVSGDLTYSLPEYNALAAYCSDIRSPEGLCSACLRDLRTSVTSPEHLASLILANLPSTKRISSLATSLSQLIREGSREDFGNRRILFVDGWMLSLTETRVSALAALIGRASS